MPDDAMIAGIARRLATALMTYARERRDSDKKDVAAIQTELCAAVRNEQNLGGEDGDPG